MYFLSDRIFAVPVGDLDLFARSTASDPAGPRYRLEGVDTGHDLRNVAPDDALATMLERGRSPLSVEDGIALVAEHPEILRKNHCFSLPGSRCGDERVPAIWISDGAAKVDGAWPGTRTPGSETRHAHGASRPDRAGPGELGG